MLSPRIKLEEYQNNITSIIIDLINAQDPGEYRSYNGNGAGKIIVELNQSSPCYRKIEKYPLKENKKLIFTFAGSDTDYLGFRSSIVDAFNGSCEGKNNVNWARDNYTLEIPAGKEAHPNLTINIWNLSIHV
ncbi:MAG: hypothetical protein GXY48_08115 [Methanomicrobiales archaeon]|nr:hypothetical protein [Methanomicrobiales archaeon]